MNLVRRLVCVSLAVGSFLPLWSATPVADLVSERAAIIITVHDAPTLFAQWGQSPWAKTWNDEQVKRYFAPLRAKLKVDEWGATSRDKTGYTFDELLAFATGDAIMAVENVDFARENPPKIPQVLVAVEIGDNTAKVEALLAKIAKDQNATDETADFSGVAVHTVRPPASGDKEADGVVWAIVEGKWLLSPLKDSVMGAIDAVKSGGVQNPWGKSERYAQLQHRTGDAQVNLVVNAETIFPVLKSTLEDRNKANPQQASGFDSQALLLALGLDTWRDFYASAKLSDTSTEMHGGLTFSEARGLVKVLAYRDGPPQTPSFVSGKWVSVSAGKFSLKEAFAAIEEILENFNPAISGLVQGQIRSANKQLGIDIKRDLIGNLGDTFLAANTISPNAPAGGQPTLADFEQFFAVSLDNQDVFTNAIEAVKRSFGPQAESMFTTKDYLGQKIFSFKNPNPGQSKALSYTIAKGYLFVSVGSSAPIETALQGLAGSQPTLWENPEVAAAFAQMPSNASAFQYQDVRAMIGSLFQTLSSAASLMNHSALPAAPSPEDSEDNQEAPTRVPSGGGSSVPIDPSAQPDPATIAKYWSHSWGFAVRDSNGVHGTSFIVYPK